MKNFCQWASALILFAGGVALASSNPAGVIAEGSPAATPYFIQDSGVAGPTVLVVGGVHGNAPAGAQAADQIRHWPICRGKLIVVPRANVAALAAKKRLTPGIATNLANLNRNFPMKGGAGEARGQLAAALWRFVQEQKPAWLLDLHEGADFRASNTNLVGSSLIVSSAPETDAAAAVMLSAVNSSITNRQQRFVRLRTPVNGSLARAVVERLGVRTMIVETTTKGQPLSRRTRQHRILVHALLKYLAMIDSGVTPEWLTDHAAGPAPIRLALYDAEGSSGAGVPRVLEDLGAETNVTVTCVGSDDIRGGALDQFDEVMFTGGSGSAQAASLGADGRAHVKRFVENGGGYVGICAGAYPACAGFSWGLQILDAKTVSPKWQRGKGTVQVELTSAGRVILGDLPEPFDCHYAQGPILTRAQSDELPDYEVLALFRTELAENDTPRGVMINSPAIVAARCGKGRVLCFSPHPEQTPGLERFTPRAVAWVAGEDKGGP